MDGLDLDLEKRGVLSYELFEYVCTRINYYKYLEMKCSNYLNHNTIVSSSSPTSTNSNATSATKKYHRNGNG